MKVNIEPWARIRKDDKPYVREIKVLHICKEMIRNNMKIKAIQWQFKLGPEWMTLDIAYTVIAIAERE